MRGRAAGGGASLRRASGRVQGWTLRHCCVGRNCRKPHTGMRTGLKVEKGTGGRSQGPEVTRVFESRCQLGFPRPSSPSAAGTSAPRTQNAQSSLLVQPSAVSWRAASAAARRQGDAGSPSTAGCRLQGRFKADAVHEAPRRKRARARPTGNRVAW